MNFAIKAFLSSRRIAIQNFLVRYENIYIWDYASKARFIAFMSALSPVTTGGAWALLYLLDLDGLAMSQRDLVEGIVVCSIISATMLALAGLAQVCVRYDVLHRPIFRFTLFVMAISQSLLYTVIGVFDGMSWLLFFMYAAIGFVLLAQRHVIISTALVIVTMILLSVFAKELPFTVRTYRFTNEVSIQSMTTVDLISNWLMLGVAGLVGVYLLGFLMGAWRHREEDLMAKSYVDELTSVLNRRAIMESLNEEVLRAIRGGYDLSIAMLDLDFFKNINDKHGHPFGDKVLVDVATHLSEVIRKKDLIGRYGGEEFLMILPECSGDLAGNILERLRTNLAAHVVFTEMHEEVSVTISAGLATLSKSDIQSASILSRADKALYQAKELGRNRVERLEAV